MLRQGSKRLATVVQGAEALQQAAAFSSAPAPAPPQPELINVTVDGRTVQVPKNVSVIQACEAAGVDIPRFCYHPRLQVAGNCRMCLVEIEKAPKPVASCAFPVAPNMVVKTQTPTVKKAREGVMEFLLINHPLDCPICDQGGECDLQDQAMAFGSDRSRHTEVKRSVEDKNLGPFVKTVMTRCIHCTRCVRFASEVAGVPDLGVTGRGNASEIGTYVEKAMSSELSGNVIDLCPVGALTSKPAAFTGRNWELRATESIDVSDALGCNIRVDSRGTEVMRIVPRLNEAVNEEWISDKARFQYDSLRRQRLHVPYAKGPDGRLGAVTWGEALRRVGERVAGAGEGRLRAVAGKLADVESMTALRDLFHRLGASDLRHESSRLEGGEVDADVRSGYVANSGVQALETSDCILLVGSNPRLESPVLNARLRKAFLYGASVGVVGPKADLTYRHSHLGDSVEVLQQLAQGKHEWTAKLKAAKRPSVLVGPSVLQRADRDAVLAALGQLVEAAGVVREGWNGYNVLHDAASRVGALDIGFTPAPTAPSVPPQVVFLLGSDDYDEALVPKDAFVVYLGSHGDRGAARADVVLPGAAYTEKSATYVNLEGRVQRTRPAVPLVGDAREDWKVVRALSEVLGRPLPYDTIEGVRARMADLAPHLAKVNDAQKPLWLGQYMKALESRVASKALDKATPLQSSVDNFFQTDAISRASPSLAKAIEIRKGMRAQHTI